MKTCLKAEQGFTIMELVIALAILVMVLAAGYSLFSFGLIAFSGQSDNVDNQTKARQVLRDISRELRKVDKASIQIEPEKSITIGGVSYTFEEHDHNLLKDGQVLATGIKSFRPSWGQNNEIIIEITTLANAGHEVTLSSSIWIRE